MTDQEISAAFGPDYTVEILRSCDDYVWSASSWERGHTLRLVWLRATHADGDRQEVISTMTDLDARYIQERMDCNSGRSTRWAPRHGSKATEERWRELTAESDRLKGMDKREARQKMSDEMRGAEAFCSVAGIGATT
jgi:hypothetical protein